MSKKILPVQSAVAIEFLDVLRENTLETITAYLIKIKADENIIALLANLGLLGIYSEAYAHDKNSILVQNFGIEEITLRTINLIARNGGAFYTSNGDSTVTKKTHYMSRLQPIKSLEVIKQLSNNKSAFIPY